MEGADKKLISTEHGSEQSFCEPCLQVEDVKTNAIGRCMECEENMCETCFEDHRVAPGCRYHVWVDISEICKKHDYGYERIEFYCLTHEAVGCKLCMDLEHKNCKQENIKEVAKTEEKFNQMCEKLDWLKYVKENSEEKLQKNKYEIDELNRKSLEACKKFRSDLNTYLDKAKECAISHIKKLTSESFEQHKKLQHNISLLMIEVGQVRKELNPHHASKTVSFVHAVMCKPKIEDIERKYEQIKHKNAFRKFQYVPTEKLADILKSPISLGKLSISSGNIITRMAPVWMKNILYKFLPVTEYQLTALETQLASYETVMKEKGPAGVIQKLNQDKDLWKSVELNLAVTGQAGSGKSSFINAIRGLTADDPDAAEVGVTETTTACKSYKHPYNPNFIVWDMPGIGTPGFPQSDYKSKVQFHRYDFFIIIGFNRFTAYDVWLAEQVLDVKKSFFFVQAKIDESIRSEQGDHPGEHSEDVEQRVVSKVRNHLNICLQKLEINNPEVFLISNRNADKYDFGKLNEKLLASCEGLQKDAMAMSLVAVTKKILAQKKEVLGKRIETVSLQIASKAREHEQISMFKDAINYFQKQFNIDKSTLAENKELLFLSDENLKEFEVIFDGNLPGRELQIQTPTATRQSASLVERFADWFSWTKKNTLLYKYSVTALNYNLDLLYKKALSLYEEKMAKQVHSNDQ